MLERERINRLKKQPEMPAGYLDYFKKIVPLLQVQGGSMSVGGINLKRSIMSCVHTLSGDIIEVLVRGDRSVWVGENIFDTYDYLREAKMRIEGNGIQVPLEPLRDGQKQLLTRLRVLYNWSHQDALRKRRDGYSYEGTPIEMPIPLVAKLLDPLVDQEEVSKAWEEIKDGPQRCELYYRQLDSDVNDIRFPINRSRKLR